ncbi:hypothetical protein WHR41_08341 [Cladosporium halotolerans]|uniref:Uncharacterized protein n=1 Tax=Cladosporium halotolerans TaxID=1052096 RepID=A0AB34KD26_9PEZI
MEMEIDPEIAAAMGFSSFGGPSKKRKLDADEAVTRANQNPSAMEEPQHNTESDSHGPISDATRQRAEGLGPTRDNITLADESTMSLQALRRGVRNERGDVAYFLPSFLEDPWEKLKSKKTK